MVVAHSIISPPLAWPQYIEAKILGGGGITGFVSPGGAGRIRLRLDWNWQLQRFEMYARLPHVASWGSSVNYAMSSFATAAGRRPTAVRVGMHARSWRSSGVFTIRLRDWSFTTTDAGAFPVSFAVPGNVLAANVTVPHFIPYTFTVRAWAAGATTPSTPSARSLGVTVLPGQVPLPINVSNPLLRAGYWVDFSRERGGTSLSFSADLTGNRNWAAQTNTGRQP